MKKRRNKRYIKKRDKCRICGGKPVPSHIVWPSCCEEKKRINDKVNKEFSEWLIVKLDKGMMAIERLERWEKMRKCK